ncbi:TPA: hypothetical protein ACKRC4_002550 [Proteus mirabilis]
MPEFNDFENIHILLSHKKHYGTSKTLIEILSDSINLETLSQLSILSFRSNEERKFRKWSKSNLTSSKKSSSDELYIYGRAQILECWKLILSKINDDSLSRDISHPLNSLSMLHELFTYINDYKNQEEPHQYIIKSAITHSRDDFKYKLYRAHKIFSSGKKIATYVKTFQEKSGFLIEDYINIIYMIIARHHKLRDSDNFDVILFKDWVIDLHKASQETGIDLTLLITVMKSVSFNIEEGANFSVSTINEPSNYDVFRNKPFLRLSETEYLPIEGRLVEELLFDNLFHRIHFSSGKSKQYLDDFGKEFEGYVQYLCEISCSLEKTGLYEYIPEFSYGRSKSKSPDAMILCSENKTFLAFEVKASRYLDSILTSENRSDEIEKSLKKLKTTPWMQVHKSVCRIVHEKRHPKIIEGLACLFISVTMNEIPLSLIDHKIIIQKRDVSYCFYSLGIHTFELLLSIMTTQHDYTAYDILRNAYNVRHKISTKTCLLRFYKEQRNISPLDKMVAEFVYKKYRIFMDRYNSSTK